MKVAPTTNASGWKKKSARRVIFVIAAIAAVLVVAGFIHRGQDQSHAAAAPIGVVGHSAQSADEPQRPVESAPQNGAEKDTKRAKEQPAAP